MACHTVAAGLDWTPSLRSFLGGRVSCLVSAHGAKLPGVVAATSARPVQHRAGVVGPVRVPEGDGVPVSAVRTAEFVGGVERRDHRVQRIRFVGMIRVVRGFNWAPVRERLRLLRRRAAVPAVVLAGLALVRQATYSWEGAVLVWRWVQGVPALAWLTSSTGLLVLALVWVGFLLFRPWSWVGSDGWRVERVRTLILEAITEVRADKPAPKNVGDAFDNCYSYIRARGLLDDACVASVTVDLEAFFAREERMYKAADVAFQPVPVTVAYLQRVADRLTFADLDPGFRIPESFADWCKGHQPNIRPVTWS